MSKILVAAVAATISLTGCSSVLPAAEVITADLRASNKQAGDLYLLNSRNMLCKVTISTYLRHSEIQKEIIDICSKEIQ